MNYAEEQLEQAIENELEAIKLRNKELVLENEKLKNGRDTLNQRLDIIYTDNEKIRELAESRGKYNQKLENDNKFMEKKLLEYETEISNLKSKNKELSNGLDYANNNLEESFKNSDLFENESKKLKKIIKDLANLL